MNDKASISPLTIRNIEAIHAPSFSPNLNRDYVVKGMFSTGEVSMICGAPGLGKTAIVAAMCAHAALGRDFADYHTHESCVVYFAAEDAYGVLCRSHPYLADPAFDAAPFHVVPAAFDLTDPEAVSDIRGFVDSAKQLHGLPRALVVIDTLNRSIGANDENSAAVMGVVLQHAAEIALKCNAAVVIVHHVGAGDGARPRGSSALEGNVDSLYMLTRDAKGGDLVFLRAKKTKNASGSKAAAFRIGGHSVGLDADGEEVTVPKAIPQGDAAKAPSQKPANLTRAPAAVQFEERVADVLRVLRDHGHGQPGATLQRSEIAERVGSPFRKVQDKRDSLLKAVKRSLEALVERCEIEDHEGGFRIQQAGSTDQENAET